MGPRNQNGYTGNGTQWCGRELVSGQALLLGLPHQQVLSGLEFNHASTLKDEFDKGLA